MGAVARRRTAGQKRGAGGDLGWWGAGMGGRTATRCRSRGLGLLALGQPLDQKIVQAVKLLLKGVESPDHAWLIDLGDIHLEHSDALAHLVNVALDQAYVFLDRGPGIGNDRLPKLDDREDGTGHASGPDDEPDDCGEVFGPVLLHGKNPNSRCLVRLLEAQLGDEAAASGIGMVHALDPIGAVDPRPGARDDAEAVRDRPGVTLDGDAPLAGIALRGRLVGARLLPGLVLVRF